MKLLDSTGMFELKVGLITTDLRSITALRPEGDEEGGGPEVEVDGEWWDCHPLNYQAEGPDFPENWVCGEAEIANRILPSTTECGYFRRVAVSFINGHKRGEFVTVEYGRHLDPARTA